MATVAAPQSPASERFRSFKEASSIPLPLDKRGYWSGGGYARANTKNGSAKVGRKGDPLLVSMVVVVAVAVADLV